MPSIDEMKNGMTFILKWKDATGAPMQWVQSLRGTVAKHWYDIYVSSDWAALRVEASRVFRNPVSEEEAEKIHRSGRCIVIKPDALKANELVGPEAALRVL